MCRRQCPGVVIDLIAIRSFVSLSSNSPKAHQMRYSRITIRRCMVQAMYSREVRASRVQRECR
jgi:hypothetical protein